MITTSAYSSDRHGDHKGSHSPPPEDWSVSNADVRGERQMGDTLALRRLWNDVCRLFAARPPLASRAGMSSIQLAASSAAVPRRATRHVASFSRSPDVRLQEIGCQERQGGAEGAPASRLLPSPQLRGTVGDQNSTEGAVLSPAERCRWKWNDVGELSREGTTRGVPERERLLE